ncbi:MAG: DUF2844 domain-containing protein [Candidatus Sulfotelmatobacter sp.]|jgi:hypothetical protein
MRTLLNCRLRLISSLMLLAGLLGFSCPALAALGGDVSSVEADRAHMKASIQVTQADGYDVHQMRIDGGTVVKEYVSPEGRVFAVTWQGPFVPDMQQVLGSYFQRYSLALQAQKKRYGRAPLSIQQPGLVVQTGGHMRAYFGRAYVPEMVPTGVRAETIK